MTPVVLKVLVSWTCYLHLLYPPLHLWNLVSSCAVMGVAQEEVPARVEGDVAWEL